MMRSTYRWGRALGVVWIDNHGGGVFENRCVKARKPVNEEATRLYRLNCLPNVTHQVLGDVMVVPDADYED